jgi:hypothetical protein
MAGTCTQPLRRPSLDISQNSELADHETVNLSDLQSYDHRRSQADSRSQSTVWGNAQPMYSQYLLPTSYPMLDQYSCFSGLYPQSNFQETLNQLYQLPLYPWQASMQDGVAGPVHGADFGIESRAELLSSSAASIDADRKYKDRITSGHGDRRGFDHLCLRHLVATERIRQSKYTHFELRDQAWLDRCQCQIRG